MAAKKTNALYIVDYLDATFGLRKINFNYEESASDFVNQLLSQGCTYIHFYKIACTTLFWHGEKENDVQKS